MSKMTILENQREISSLCSYLESLSRTAEQHFWNSLSTKTDRFLGITTVPQINSGHALAACNDMAAGAVEVCHRIMEHLADLTERTYTPIDFTGAERLTIYPDFISSVTTRVRTLVSDFIAISSNAPTDFDVREELQSAFNDIFSQALVLFTNGMGPYFAPVFTNYLSGGYVSCKYIENYLLIELDAGLEWNAGVGAGFSKIYPDDILYFDVFVVDGYQDVANRVWPVAEVTGDNYLKILVPGAEAEIDWTSSEVSYSPRSTFSIRKIGGRIAAP